MIIFNYPFITIRNEYTINNNEIVVVTIIIPNILYIKNENIGYKVLINFKFNVNVNKHDSR